MARIILAQNEKALLLAKNNTYVLIADDVNADINKIELTKKLKELKFDVEMIRVVTLPPKVKSKQSKGGKRNTKIVRRSKKWYVTLKEKQKLDEKFEIVL